MNTYGIWITISFLFFVISPSSGQVTENSLHAIQKRFEAGEIFRAEIEHTYIDSFTETETVSNGSIWLSLNSYKIETPDQEILVHEGYSNVYNRRQNKRIISTYLVEEDDFAPSRFFMAGGDRFQVEERKDSLNSHIIEITFLDPYDLLSDATLQLNASGIPIRIDARDHAGNQMISVFRFGRFLSANSTYFEIQYPDDVEIIDLRN